MMMEQVVEIIKNVTGEKEQQFRLKKQSELRNSLLEPTLFTAGGISILLLTNPLQRFTTQVLVDSMKKRKKTPAL